MIQLLNKLTVAPLQKNHSHTPGMWHFGSSYNCQSLIQLDLIVPKKWTFALDISTSKCKPFLLFFLLMSGPNSLPYITLTFCISAPTKQARTHELKQQQQLAAETCLLNPSGFNPGAGSALYAESTSLMHENMMYEWCPVSHTISNDSSLSQERKKIIHA